MRALVFAFLLLGPWPLAARADVLQDRFDTVWESLWFQGGSPTAVVRWPGDIRVRIHGRDVSTHQERIMQALELVAGIAGRKVVNVSNASDTANPANLDVEIVGPRDLEGNQACFVRLTEVSSHQIRSASLKLRTNQVYYCMLHEAMHVMGILGHPSGDTVLSYFNQRVAVLSDLDRLMLTAWYSNDMQAGATPLAALSVLTAAVVAADSGKTRDAMDRRTRFLLATMREMEAYAGDQGDVPVIIKRSGTASGESMREGRRRMGLFLGLDYLHGGVVAADPASAAYWFERGARANYGPAQWMFATMHERGTGLVRSRGDAFVWYSMAAINGLGGARGEAERLAAVLTPDERAQADTRVAGFSADITAGRSLGPVPIRPVPVVSKPADRAQPADRAVVQEAQPPTGELCDARSHQNLNARCRSQAPAPVP